MLENLANLNNELEEIANINELPYAIKEELYYDFFFNTSNFLYDVWNLKVIDYDGGISNQSSIKTEMLEKNEIIYKDTIKKNLSLLPLEEQIKKLFHNKKDYFSKVKFYINYIHLHNSYKSIKTKKLLELEHQLEELSLFFEKKI